MRMIDADAIIDKMRTVMDMQDLYLPVTFMDLVVDDMPTIEAEPVNGWISVDDRLPENDGLYIVCKTIEEHQIVFEARWQDGDWKSVVKNNHLDFITHWQPLPKPPKEDKDG